ncbi:hypothetical protein F3087_35170 [Nocardia colli]|uniref:Uncharacterized protein n=1 Tax=Nocardia colli TaxID=2545717 RepID=A0A5N0E7R7_9NOCA|nr:hypothetical protein [Nocardia colli]KAA8884195.1 hypothetical protein F3087_35170 [Nocardia colli]
MNIRVEVERIVLHDLPVSQADRRRLSAAIEAAITARLAAGAARWDPAAMAVPVVAAPPIILSGNGIGALADGIATAATQAIGQSGGGRP